MTLSNSTGNATSFIKDNSLNGGMSLQISFSLLGVLNWSKNLMSKNTQSV